MDSRVDEIIIDAWNQEINLRMKLTRWVDVSLMLRAFSPENRDLQLSSISVP